MIFLPKVFRIDIIHIVKILVFATHAPNKRVVLGSDARMDAPRGRNDRLLIMNDKMPRLGGGPHHVEDDVVLAHVEVEINLHATLMGMAGHGIPSAAFLKVRKAHCELAGFDGRRNQKTVDGPLVAGGMVT